MRYYFISVKFSDKYTKNSGFADTCIEAEAFSLAHIREHVKKRIKEQGEPVDSVVILSIIPITEEEFYENKKYLNDKL